MGSHVTGTATDHDDFLNDLVSFLTTDATLVAGNEEWSIAWSAPIGAPNESDIVLEGPGLSGADSIYIGLRLNEDVPNDRFSLSIIGMTGVIPSAEQFDEHVNCTPNPVRIFLDDSPMPYWFSATGRKFTVTAKVSTVYETAYAGLFLPFASPSTYNYPLFVGGMAAEGSDSVDWRSTSADHTAFVDPLRTVSVDTSAWMLSPTAEWLRCGDGDALGPVSLGPDNFGASVFDITKTTDADAYGYKDIVDRMGPAFGGDYTLTPIVIVQSSPQNQTYGILDGVYHVAGRGNAAENTVSFNSKDHLVLQNAFRTTIGDYFAVALEE